MGGQSGFPGEVTQERAGRQGAGSGHGRKMFWLMKEQRAATTGNPFREVARTVYGCGVRLEEGEKGQRAGASGTG